MGLVNPLSLRLWWSFWTVVTIVVVAAAAAGSTTTSSSRSTTNNKPNIVFLVVESTDGRTWQRGYQDDVIPIPNLRSLMGEEEEDDDDKEAGEGKDDSASSGPHGGSGGGFSFYRHYSNSPICCPSRSSFWSGKFPHKIFHLHDDNGRKVNGVWNNLEGLPDNYNDTIFKVLERDGYEIKMSGKQHYSTVRGDERIDGLNPWSMYVDFPYNIPKNGGWQEVTWMCNSEGIVDQNDTKVESNHWSGDWKTVNETIQWIHQYQKQQEQQQKNTTRPFFVYQGMNIVHPQYHTNSRYFDSIDPNKISVPPWVPLKELHPCDLQTTMRKGCLPSSKNASDEFYSTERRRRIRRIYYAMISEFDAMVGRYIQAIRQAGVEDNTIFIVTSDHGDMQMEHQQFYKHVAYEASSSVPLIIYDPRRKGNGKNRIIRSLTQHVDLFPTIMDLAGVDKAMIPKGLDGFSLLPLMMEVPPPPPPPSSNLSALPVFGKASDNTTSLSTTSSGRDNSVINNDDTSRYRPDFIVSQLHGGFLAMSWFSIVRPMPCVQVNIKPRRRTTTTTASSICTMKLIIWGTGREVDSQLFDLTNDPDETTNRIHDPRYAGMVHSLESTLQSVVDYPKVALDVAAYNQESVKEWIRYDEKHSNSTSHWKERIRNWPMWQRSWERAGDDIAAQTFMDWLMQPPKIVPCRKELIWPPPNSTKL